MAIPDYQSLMGPLLDILADEKLHTTKVLIRALSDPFNLSEQERTQLFNSGHQLVCIDNWVAWARTYLKKAGCLKKAGWISNTKRSVLEIAELGKQTPYRPHDQTQARCLRKRNLQIKTLDTDFYNED